ncbi:hypothetical protein COLO4_02667 [Corchorus olitorius]|uniref:Uncharacterized protein n=1 Tax=Corchorus olitorius TaxID=93759 RepID=A0A1R3L0I5_9ROSI|nr:hypothetical protein COLO4_02667 [Corchorus olitorius]
MDRRRQLDQPGGMDHADRDRLLLRIEARQLRLGADDGEGLAIDRRAIGFIERPRPPGQHPVRGPCPCAALRATRDVQTAFDQRRESGGKIAGRDAGLRTGGRADTGIDMEDGAVGQQHSGGWCRGDALRDQEPPRGKANGAVMGADKGGQRRGIDPAERQAIDRTDRMRTGLHRCTRCRYGVPFSPVGQHGLVPRHPPGGGSVAVGEPVRQPDQRIDGIRAGRSHAACPAIGAQQ